jgi:hypothetical protein
MKIPIVIELSRLTFHADASPSRRLAYGRLRPRIVPTGPMVSPPQRGRWNAA